MRYRILVILIMVALFVWHKPILKAFFVLEYKDYIANYCRQYQVNPMLISALVFTESHFDTGAQSHKGALGLMQIMPSTGGWVAEKLMWRNFSPQDLLDPQKNLKAGIWYIAYLKQLFNHNEYLALASYNAGSRYVSQWVADGTWDGNVIKIEQIPFQETKKYVLKIMVVQKIYGYLYPELLASSNWGTNSNQKSINGWDTVADKEIADGEKIADQREIIENREFSRAGARADSKESYAENRGHIIGLR